MHIYVMLGSSAVPVSRHGKFCDDQIFTRFKKVMKFMNFNKF